MTAAPLSFRLLAYNILEGLRPVGAAAGERRRFDRERLDAARQLLAATAPDIVVLNEALFCRDYAGQATDYAELLGFPHHAAALYDREWGNAILSRFPVLAAEETRIYNRGGLRAMIATPAGTVTVASYHPHPGRYPRNKAADFAALLDGVAGAAVLCGDFNAISPEDPIDLAELRQGFRRFSPDPDAAVARFIDSGGAVFAALAAHGMRDAIPPAGRRYTIPTDLLSTDKGAAMRLDHIFVSAEIAVLHGEVVHDTLSQIISDHHPVLADLALNGTAHTPVASVST
jgi:endonuclease/exonuclease/phosphatase family metal-dependent hydrolase